MKTDPEPDEFERWLQSQSRAALPPQWRETIMEAACPPGRGVRSTWHRRWWEALSPWLSPSPMAWRALAGAWVCILLLGWLGRYESAEGSSQTGASAVARVGSWSERQRLVQLLLSDGAEDQTKPTTVGPRSSLRPRSTAA
jgi:hypothetical protein